MLIKKETDIDLTIDKIVLEIKQGNYYYVEIIIGEYYVDFEFNHDNKIINYCSISLEMRDLKFRRFHPLEHPILNNISIINRIWLNDVWLKSIRIFNVLLPSFTIINFDTEFLPLFRELLITLHKIDKLKAFT